MAAGNQYDRQNDPELGSGIYSRMTSKEPTKQLKNVCYCDYSFLGIPCPKHDMTVEEAEEFKALDVLVAHVPPEPETPAEAHAAMIGDDPLAYAGDWAADPDLILDPEPEPWPSWKRQCTDSGYGDFGPM